MDQGLFVVPAFRIKRPSCGYGERLGGSIPGNTFQDRCLRIAVSQERVKNALHIPCASESAVMEEDGVAETVDHHGVGNAVRADILVQFFAFIAPHGESDVVFPAVFRDIFHRVFRFHAQGDKGYPVAVLLINFTQERKLHQTRTAPGRPEIDQHRFMIFQGFGQGEGFPFGIRCCELRERFPQEFCIFLRRRGSGAQRQQGHDHACEQCHHFAETVFHLSFLL